METLNLQETMTTENYQRLIPTIISNTKKLNFNNLEKASFYAALSHLPLPPKSEIEYLINESYTCHLLGRYIQDNVSVSHKYSYVSEWMKNSAVCHISSFYVLEEQKKDSNFIENLYKNSKNSILLIFLARSSIYTTLKCLEYLAYKQDYDSQKIAVAVCSQETLIHLTKSSYDKIRVEAYKRLGPMNFLDEMLVDKSRHVRSLAAEWMPMGYAVPQKALSDRSYWSFSSIVEKVSIDQIPMILGNKKLAKNKHLMERLQARLDSKI